MASKIDRGADTPARIRRVFQQLAAAPLDTLGLDGAVVVVTGSYADPAWLTSLAWSKITGTPTTLAGYGITDPVVLTSGSYADPAWVTSLAWSKITGTPTTLAGYGVTDPVVLASGSYADPAWITSLAWSKIATTPTTLAGYGITDAVPSSRTLTAGNGLTGGGDLSANRSLAVALASDPGLEFATALLRAKVKSAGGITRDSDGLSLTEAVAVGSYTPTATAGANIASLTTATCHYVRIGSRVIVFGRVLTTNTSSAGVLTTFDVTLPVATNNFASINDAAGVAGSQSLETGRVFAVSGTQTVRVSYTSQTGGNAMNFIFGYVIQ